MSTLAGSCIYADNYFTIYVLVKHLKNEYNRMYTGTARGNRIGNPGLLSTVEMNKKSCQRGSSDYKSKDGIIAVKWKDNNVVTLLSSECGMEPTTAICRYDKKNKTKKGLGSPNNQSLQFQYWCRGQERYAGAPLLHNCKSKKVVHNNFWLPYLSVILQCMVGLQAWLQNSECEKNVGLKEFRLDIATAFLQIKTTARSTRLCIPFSDLFCNYENLFCNYENIFCTFENQFCTYENHICTYEN